eukprot:14142508-Alexandrium_andersonii.AAC.1
MPTQHFGLGDGPAGGRAGWWLGGCFGFPRADTQGQSLKAQGPQAAEYRLRLGRTAFKQF